MSELRARINKGVRKLLDEYGVSPESDETEVLDSSHVTGGLVIIRFLRRKRKAKDNRFASDEIRRQEVENATILAGKLGLKRRRTSSQKAVSTVKFKTQESTIRSLMWRTLRSALTDHRP
jgi:hypothetical protein